MKEKANIAILSAFIMIFVLACTSNNGIEPNISLYLGAGNHGDIITYQINHDDRTFSYHNETTDQSGSGTYTIMAGMYEGVYECTVNGYSEKHYSVEVPDVMLATSIPSGNNDNTLVCCVTNEQALPDISQIAGKFSWIFFQDSSLPGPDLAWGGFELMTTTVGDNSHYKFTYGVVPTTANPEDVGFNFDDYYSGTAPWDTDIGGEGRWWIENNRLGYCEDAGFNPNKGVNRQGIVLPSKIMLIDEGPGNGASLGFSYPSTHASLSDIAGDYCYIGALFNGMGSDIGKSSVYADGTASYTYKILSDGTVGFGTLKSGAAIASVNNLFKFLDQNDKFITYMFILSNQVSIAIDVDVATGKLIDVCFGARLQ